MAWGRELAGDLGQSRVQALSSMAFIGEPWPTKRAGIRTVIGAPGAKSRPMSRRAPNG